MKTLFSLSLMLTGLALVSITVRAQVPGKESVFRQMPPQFEAIAQQLRDAPPQQYDFSKSNLSDVLRFLATDAKISFISLPEDSPEASRVITFSINGSPFSVLETLCKANGLSLLPEENGMWYIRSAEDKELIGKSYSVRYNSMEQVGTVTDGGNVAAANGTIQSASVDLQGAREIFFVKRSQLINDIRTILDLPLENERGEVTAETQPLNSPGQNSNQMMQFNNPNELSHLHQPKVIWKSDSNTLYVVATRLQHLWVEGYLSAADKAQSLIAIEVKFIETSHDPSKELGIDWSGTLGQTGTFRQFKEVDKEGVYKFDIFTNREGGFRADAASMIDFVTDFNDLGGTAAWPTSALLGSQDLSVRLRALLNDQDTKTVSYPRMVTLNNREVVIRSVVNQPVLDGTTAISGGGSATTSTKITYLPIGTVLNILPKQMDLDRVLLNIKITVSSIIGEQIISGNPYPVATSRVYNAPVEVNNGYTVAVGGLDEAKERGTETGVPLLGKVPVLGYLFKTKTRQKNHKNLMLFITPTLIDPKGGGLAEEPQAVLPRRPDHLMPQRPAINAGGGLDGGPHAVPNAVAYLARECDVIQTTIDEARATETESKKLTEMKIALNQLESQVEAMAPQYPQNSQVFSQATIDIAQLHSRVGKMKREILKKKYY